MCQARVFVIALEGTEMDVRVFVNGKENVAEVIRYDGGTNVLLPETLANEQLRIDIING